MPRNGCQFYITRWALIRRIRELCWQCYFAPSHIHVSRPDTVVQMRMERLLGQRQLLDTDAVVRNWYEAQVRIGIAFQQLWGPSMLDVAKLCLRGLGVLDLNLDSRCVRGVLAAQLGVEQELVSAAIPHIQLSRIVAMRDMGADDLEFNLGQLLETMALLSSSYEQDAVWNSGI